MNLWKITVATAPVAKLARMACALLLLSCAACGRSENPEAVGRGSGMIIDGRARFTVLTPTLIRLEYADDGQFEDRPTQTTGQRMRVSAPFGTHVDGDTRVITTAALTLRYVF